MNAYMDHLDTLRHHIGQPVVMHLRHGEQAIPPMNATFARLTFDRGKYIARVVCPAGCFVLDAVQVGIGNEGPRLWVRAFVNLNPDAAELRECQVAFEVTPHRGYSEYRD